VVRFLHYNDVYELDARRVEPIGGASRFKSLLEKLMQDGVQNPVVTFGGDAFNPSTFSTITKGKHMVPVLRNLHTRVGVLGNHDFDFGHQVAQKYAAQTQFPWLLSNLFDEHDKQPLSGALEYLVEETNGVRIGFIGLVESEWLFATNLSPDEYTYRDFVSTGNRLVKFLRTEKAVDVVVCLSHCRMPNDERIAKEVVGLDLLLCGHDHFAKIVVVNGVTLVKGGTDFRELAEVVLDTNLRDPVTNLATVRMARIHEVTAELPTDEEMESVILQVGGEVKQKLGKVIAHVTRQLVASASIARTQECNLGNLITDCMRAQHRSHVALLNSGTIRSDSVYETGDFTLGMLTQILPFPDMLVVLEVRGSDIWAALENGVQSFPAEDGRFLQVSGISFTFDASRPPLDRVLSVTVGEEPLERERCYKLATSPFLASGKEGFDALCNGKIIVDEEDSLSIPTLLRQHCIKLQVAKAFSSPSATSAGVEKLVRSAFRKSPFTLHPALENRIVERGTSSQMVSV